MTVLQPRHRVATRSRPARRSRLILASRVSGDGVFHSLVSPTILVNDKAFIYEKKGSLVRGLRMSVASKEREWADRARRFVKAELKRAEISYAELARRLGEHGLEETEASIAGKLNRGTFAATFFFATMKVIGREQVNLADL
jgi:hypothetical protein